MESKIQQTLYEKFIFDQTEELAYVSEPRLVKKYNDNQYVEFETA